MSKLAQLANPLRESHLDAIDQSLPTKSSTSCVIHCFSMLYCRLDITHGLRNITAFGQEFAARCRLVIKSPLVMETKLTITRQAMLCIQVQSSIRRLELLVFKSCKRLQIIETDKFALKGIGSLCMPIHVWSLPNSQSLLYCQKTPAHFA